MLTSTDTLNFTFLERKLQRGFYLEEVNYYLKLWDKSYDLSDQIIYCPSKDIFVNKKETLISFNYVHLKNNLYSDCLIFKVSKL